MELDVTYLNSQCRLEIGEARRRHLGSKYGKRVRQLVFPVLSLED